jgi:hypothetical protein
MIIFNKDHFNAALNMIQVTPENYKKLTADMVINIYHVVAEAEKNLKETKQSSYGNPEKEAFVIWAHSLTLQSPAVLDTLFQGRVEWGCRYGLKNHQEGQPKLLWGG